MTHASLFSGIGGPEVAAAMLGWDNAFHCEINPFGRQVLEYWFPDSVSYEDITKTDFKEWRGKIDVLTGGFPCQPFSYAGKRGGREDERYLWPEMLRAIGEIRPAWVVGENVAGLATMAEGWLLTEMGSSAAMFEEDHHIHEWLVEQTFTIEKISKELEELGYSVQPVLIPAAAVGAPHRRDRIFILAFDADTHRRNDVRVPGEDAGAGGREGVQERHEVRLAGESNQVRPTPRGAAADADRRGSGEIPPTIPTRLSNGNKSFRNGGKRYASDSVRKGLEGKDKPRSSEGGERMRVRRNPSGHDWEGLRPEERWAEFPSISPVHRGNDGLPFRMDRASLSFSKWRTESIKAYGNAIVPQVMYRIFQAIEEVSQNLR